MAARWWTLKELVDLAIPGFGITDVDIAGASGGVDLATYEWEGRLTATTTVVRRELVVNFGIEAPRFLGAQVRITELANSTQQGQLDLYSNYVNAECFTFENPNSFLTSASWPQVNRPTAVQVAMSPNPSAILATIPKIFEPDGFTETITIGIRSSAENTNGLVSISGRFRIEFFVDLGSSDFWTDFIGTSPA
ncbi:MAG: hypothetical protein ACRC2H_06760 [Silanimonas sp.]